jgi:uncharacterized protein (DUF169 family)
MFASSAVEGRPRPAVVTGNMQKKMMAMFRIFRLICTEYLIAPFKTATPRIAIPGLGDRIFSMTQDDELVLSIPGKLLLPMYQ